MLPDILGGRLDALPDTVRETKRFPLGRYRGLAFGVVLHPGGAAEVYPRRGRPPATACFRATIAARAPCSTPWTGWPASYDGQLRRPRDATWRSPKGSSATTRPASAAVRPRRLLARTDEPYATSSRPASRSRARNRERTPRPPSPNSPSGSRP